MRTVTSSSRGPIFKHDILSAPLPDVHHTRHTKKNGQLASHRSRCDEKGLSSTNRGKRYLTPAQRKEILKKDPTAFLIESGTKNVWCRVCEESKILEGDRYLLTGWWNHTDTDKHRENARNHLSPAGYLSWLHFIEEHARPKKHRGASRRRSSSIAHLSPPYSTPPPPYTAAPSPLVPVLPPVRYAPATGIQNFPAHGEAIYNDSDYPARPHFPRDPFRLRPATWVSAHGPYTFGGENSSSYLF